ncbi:MAG: hypothetical protein K2P22_03955, partial [Lachnospiraceae bacterium]|nr:hypothetical protein [Lachnospiraceae bacterium]
LFVRVERAGTYTGLQEAAESSMQNFLSGMEYFDMAVVTADGFAAQTAYGSAWLYVACLSVVLSFLGNKAASAIVFQVFLQMAGLGLGYAVTRRSAGRLPACVVLLYLACSPGYLEMLKNLGPECLFFDLYLIVMLVVVGFLKAYCKNRCGRGAALAGAVGAGALIGVLGYLDLTAFTILALGAVVVTGKKSRTEEEPVRNGGGISAAVAALILTGCGAGFLGTAAAVSASSGTGLMAHLTQWASVHVWNTRTFGFQPLYPYSLDMLLFGVLAVLASFLVFEFFRSGREQNYMLWILLCIVAAPTPLAVFGVQPFGLLSMYLWGVLAGLGLQNCIFGGQARLMQTMIEEINQAAGEIEAVEEGGPVQAGRLMQEGREKNKVGLMQADGQSEEAELIQANGQPKEADHIQEGGNKDKAEEIEVLDLTKEETPEEQQAEEPVKKPRYIKNPLPLPKKHVRRQMDYQYTVDDKDMNYDVEVGDDDDFDL